MIELSTCYRKFEFERRQLESGAAKTKKILKTPQQMGFIFFYFRKSNLDRKKRTAANAGVAAMLPPALE